MRVNISLITSIVLVTMFSCKGKTVSEKEIVNNSSYDITFELKYSSGTVEEVIVEANSAKVIGSGETRGKRSEADSCTAVFDNIVTNIPLGRSLKFNPTLEKHWTESSEQTKNFPKEYSHTCILTIENDDVN